MPGPGSGLLSRASTCSSHSQETKHASAPSYLLQLSTPSPHKHHRVFSVGVRGHGAHALRPVLVQRVPLNHPQASERLVQHQAAEIISDLLRLWRRNKEGRLLEKSRTSTRTQAGMKCAACGPARPDPLGLHSTLRLLSHAYYPFS